MNETIQTTHVQPLKQNIEYDAGQTNGIPVAMSGRQGRLSDVITVSALGIRSNSTGPEQSEQVNAGMPEVEVDADTDLAFGLRSAERETGEFRSGRLASSFTGKGASLHAI